MYEIVNFSAIKPSFPLIQLVKFPMLQEMHSIWLNLANQYPAKQLIWGLQQGLSTAYWHLLIFMRVRGMRLILWTRGSSAGVGVHLHSPSTPLFPLASKQVRGLLNFHTGKLCFFSWNRTDHRGRVYMIHGTRRDCNHISVICNNCFIETSAKALAVHQKSFVNKILTVWYFSKTKVESVQFCVSKLPVDMQKIVRYLQRRFAHFGKHKQST